MTDLLILVGAVCLAVAVARILVQTLRRTDTRDDAQTQ